MDSEAVTVKAVHLPRVTCASNTHNLEIVCRPGVSCLPIYLMGSGATYALRGSENEFRTHLRPQPWVIMQRCAYDRQGQHLNTFSTRYVTNGAAVT